VSKKRGNGEGSIHRRTDGGWCAQYTVYTAEGRKRKTLYGKTRAEVGGGSWRRRSRIAREDSLLMLETLRLGSTWTGGLRTPSRTQCGREP